ncbi:unnamed protein product [Amoebophrya sp. A120]|nr:unnamed protein product [Amoebophrya sp. A120]|eukprot:GSA120T00011431001.1
MSFLRSRKKDQLHRAIVSSTSCRPLLLLQLFAFASLLLAPVAETKEQNDLVHLVTFGTHGVFRKTQDLLDKTFFYAGFKSHNRWLLPSQPGVWEVPEEPHADKDLEVAFGKGHQESAVQRRESQPHGTQGDRQREGRSPCFSGRSEERDKLYSAKQDVDKNITTARPWETDLVPLHEQALPSNLVGKTNLVYVRMSPRGTRRRGAVDYSCLQDEKKPERAATSTDGASDVSSAVSSVLSHAHELAVSAATGMNGDHAQHATTYFQIRRLNLAATSWWQSHKLAFQQLQADYKKLNSYYLHPVYLGVRPLIIKETLEKFIPKNQFLLLQDPNKYAGIDFDSGSPIFNSSFFHSLNSDDLDTMRKVTEQEGGVLAGIFGARIPLSIRREFMSGWFRSAFRVMYEEFFQSAFSGAVGDQEGEQSFSAASSTFSRNNMNKPSNFTKHISTLRHVAFNPEQAFSPVAENPGSNHLDINGAASRTSALTEGDFDLDLHTIHDRAETGLRNNVKPFSLLDMDWLLKYHSVLHKLHSLNFFPDREQMHMDFYTMLRNLLRRRAQWCEIEKISQEQQAGERHDETVKLSPIVLSDEQVRIEPEDAFRAVCVDAEVQAAPLRRAMQEKRIAELLSASGGMDSSSSQDADWSSEQQNHFDQHLATDTELVRAFRRCSEYWREEAPMIQDTWLLVQNNELTVRFLNLWVNLLSPVHNRHLLLQMPFTDQTALGLLTRALDLKSATFPGLYERLEPNYLSYGTCRTGRVEANGAPAKATRKEVWKRVPGLSAAQSTVTKDTSVMQERAHFKLVFEQEQVEEKTAVTPGAELAALPPSCPVPHWVVSRREEGLHGLGNRLKTLGKLVHEIRRTRTRLQKREEALGKTNRHLTIVDKPAEDVKDGGMSLLSWRDTSAQDLNSKTAGRWWMFD